MAVEFRLKLLSAELLTFLAVQLIALFVGWRLVSTGQVDFQPVGQSIGSFLIAFAIATTLIILFIKFIKFNFAYKGFFALILFVGSSIVFSAFFPEWIAFFLAVGVVAVRFLIPNILTHNLALFLALAGVSAQLGTFLRVPAVIIILIALSIYDVIAVFKTKHMVTMFKSLMDRGAVMGLVIPEKLSDLGRPTHHAVKAKLSKSDKKQFIMLGGGDIAFPAMFAISALAEYGLAQSIGIVAGSLFGIAAIHFLFIFGKVKALPALPPLAICSIAGFLISFLL
ncbi:MAG: presenilin family intramembrane aspartyl protease [Nanoarchaeota archaeon]